MIQAKREWATRTLVCLRSFSNFSLFVMSDLFLMDGYLEPQHSKKQIVSSFIMICWIFIHWVNGPHFSWIRNYPGTPWPCLWWVWVRPGWAGTLWVCDIIMVIIIAQYKRLVLLVRNIFLLRRFDCLFDFLKDADRNQFRPVWCGIHETDSHHLGFVPDL